MKVELLYFDDCPSWQDADQHLRALAAEFGDLRVEHRLVTTDDEAIRLGFFGSPSIQVDGVDLFEPSADAQPGLSCRVYRTPHGFAGSPTAEQLRDAMMRRLAQPG